VRREARWNDKVSGQGVLLIHDRGREAGQMAGPMWPSCISKRAENTPKGVALQIAVGCYAVCTTNGE